MTCAFKGKNGGALCGGGIDSQPKSPRPNEEAAPANHSHSNRRQGLFLFAGPHTSEDDHQLNSQPNQVNRALSTNSFICSLPSLIRGARCYSDASIAPDSISNNARSAGLGIFFQDPNHHMRCYIKAKVEHISSVLMAESAGMALAAEISSLLGISVISFLTDSQLLASFFNGSDFDSFLMQLPTTIGKSSKSKETSL